jgi:hypothetical protein
LATFQLENQIAAFHESSTKKRNSIKDLRGAGRLAINAVNGVIDIVEAVHYNISSLGGLLSRKKRQRTSGITGFVYKNIRGVTELAGTGLDTLLDKLPAIVEEKEPTPEQEAILSALNGVIGDHLEETKNPLAIHMQIRNNGKPAATLHQIVPSGSNGQVLLLIHGSCMNDLQWNRKGHDHGAVLAHEFGYQSIYLHYNSGRHVSENGKELAQILDSFFADLSYETELVIIAHSMGGLVARSACHYGKMQNQRWLNTLQKLFSWEHHIMGHHWSKREIGLIICWKPIRSVSPFHVLVKSGVPELRTSDTAIFWMMTGISGTGLIRLATVEFLCHYRRELIATQLLQQSLANHREWEMT